jgi:hypothetical protein
LDLPAWRYEAVTLFLEGWSYGAIARKFGVAPMTARGVVQNTRAETRNPLSLFPVITTEHQIREIRRLLQCGMPVTKIAALLRVPYKDIQAVMQERDL